MEEGSTVKGCLAAFGGCVIAIALICVLGVTLLVIIALFVNDRNDGDPHKSVNAEVESKQVVLPDFSAEISNGLALVSWLERKDSLTDFQNKEEFSKLKGKVVILRGKVRDVGRTMVGDNVYVSFTVGQMNLFERINVQFNVAGPVVETVKTWMKNEERVMRGRIKSTGDLEDDVVCVSGEPITEEQYRTAILE